MAQRRSQPKAEPAPQAEPAKVEAVVEKPVENNIEKIMEAPVDKEGYADPMAAVRAETERLKALDTKPEETKEPEKEPEKAPEEVKRPEPIWNPQMLEYASQFGLTKEQFASPQAMDKACRDISDRMAALTPKAEETKPEVKEPPKKPVFQISDDLLDETKYDANVVGLAKAVKELTAYVDRVENIDQRISGYEKSEAQRQAAEQQRVLAEFTDLADTAVEQLGKPELYGQGKMSTLEGESRDQRALIVHLAVNHRNTLANLGQPVPTLAEAVAFIHRGQHPEEIKQAATQQLHDQLRRPNGQFIARPSGKVGEETLLDQRERQIQTINEFKKQHPARFGG